MSGVGHDGGVTQIGTAALDFYSSSVFLVSSVFARSAIFALRVSAVSSVPLSVFGPMVAIGYVLSIMCPAPSG